MDLATSETESFMDQQVNENNSLVAEGLSCLRSDQLLFKEISFNLSSGEVLQIEGANGSGENKPAQNSLWTCPSGRGIYKLER